MPLQKKFKTLISNLKSPLENQKRMPWANSDSGSAEVTSSQLVASPAVSKYMVHVSEFPNDPQADREAIASIEEPFYQDDQFDGSQYILEKLPEVLKLDEIGKDRDRLRRQHQAVSKKVSELVLENHRAYEKELNSVMELQETLQRACVVCANGRRQLALAKDGFTTASLGMLANYRKRQQLFGLLKSLHTIKTLQQTDVRLREMLEEEEYAGAIQLCQECQKAASTFRHYHCISELNSKLQDTLLMIEEQLDVALSKICSNFDTAHYEKLQTAYRLLGKTQTATDQSLMHFTSAIHNTAFNIVLGYVELIAGTGDSSFQKKQYSELCKHISPETFTPCLVDLCKALWEVMKSYHQAVEWHEKQDIETCEKEETAADTTDSGNMEALFNKRYIKQKLEHGLVRIWGDVQQKVKVYLLSTDISYFKYDEFISVLDLVSRLMAVGEEFCGSKSEGLQESIRKQSLNYFKAYHRSRLDELRMFLENEGWELCPVKSTFSITQLQEFKFLRSQLNKSSSNSSLNTSTTSKGRSSFFRKYGHQGNPFAVQNDDEENEEDVLATNGYGPDDSRHERGTTPESDSDSDVPDELKQDYVDEKTGEIPEKRIVRRKRFRSGGRPPIIMTNTTLNVCRLFGKYMQMISVLKPIAFDVILCMSQLFDYYLYTVFTFFASDMSNIDDWSQLSSKLNATLKRIQNSLILNENDHQEAAPAEMKDRVGHPHISPVVDLLNPAQLNGLAERVVAAESLVFLAQQLEFLQQHLENMIPVARKPFLQQFYSQTVNTAHELRNPVYRTVAARCIDYEQIYELMAAVRWDVKDLMSQHSSYVDVMLREFENVSMRLDEISHRVPLPSAVTDVLWDHVIRLTNKTLVEGFSSAKKCTNEGRALMQLDFQQFLLQLEKITDLRPIPHRDYVEAYIKAYYLPEMPLEAWVREHKEYTPKQLMGLVNCIVHVNKKARSRILTMIEDMDRFRR